jgi:hypothetical protein
LVSATEFVEDVDRDPVVVFDGLTKNWRYPGWRVSWTVGPKQVIEAVSSAGSFLDGGGSRPMQLAALPLLTEEHARAETAAIQACFKKKKNRMVDGLRGLGVRFEREPEGTFYAWGDVSGLPQGLNTGQELFRAALGEKVIVVPGHFFDVDPGQRRFGRPSRFASHVRFSYGPSEGIVEEALTRLRALVEKHR